MFGIPAGKLWLADGYHRWHAAEIGGPQTIAADVRAGGPGEAILHSVGLNAEHGWRRSHDDKRRAVLTLFNDPEWSGWSDREIARRCGVGAPFVARCWQFVASNTVIELQHDPERPATRTFVDKQGNTNTMRTSGIGRRPEPEPDYSLREDPRQLDIEQVAYDDAEEAWLEMHRENPPAGPEFVYHADAARFRGQLCEMIDTLTSPRWRWVSHAIGAWMQGRAAA
ncbi:MAG TPA: hypothetical protein VF595_14525 [Tepidisphaeraceae bacterium]